MDNENLMQRALQQAQIALDMQEVPVGCIFVIGSEIIANSQNTVNETRNPTRHAELNCIDQVIEYCKSNQLNIGEIFGKIRVIVTVEPCVMCAEALHNVGVHEVVYGCNNDRFGGTTVYDVSAMRKTSYIQTGGVLSEEALALLKQFYKGTNPMAPKNKVKIKK